LGINTNHALLKTSTALGSAESNQMANNADSYFDGNVNLSNSKFQKFKDITKTNMQSIAYFD
jgi:hypothetical protein